ncbi:MAG TPA: hypothetical protein DC026_10230 [Erythrobacter sp.]|nr:hypothetical protein [Erythrobacter sp.]|tara:strand:+ start:761 stop:1753 length:993 start_codon:yes stop_codon:yes gene_type:complete
MKSVRRRLPAFTTEREVHQKYICFDAPKRFNIFENYERTLAFILDVRTLFMRTQRKRGRRPYYANFSTIEELDPASGLILAAEIDRWRRTTSRTPVSFDHLWKKDVRDFFFQAGLFDLLHIDPAATHVSEGDEGDFETIQYRSGIITSGEEANSFREELEAKIGGDIGPRVDVYNALSEAMSNVVWHAYQRTLGAWPKAVINRWWLGGTWSKSDNMVTVQMYDHGVGIPRTLPKSEHWSEVLPLIGRIDSERSDAGMIEAAMQYGRTRTGKAGRGKGLAQMADWIESADNGSLRILSGNGSLTFLPGRQLIKERLATEFCGTLVEWKVSL